MAEREAVGAKDVQTYVLVGTLWTLPAAYRAVAFPARRAHQEAATT
jgi:hypothetical protein